MSTGERQSGKVARILEAGGGELPGLVDVDSRGELEEVVLWMGVACSALLPLNVLAIAFRTRSPWWYIPVTIGVGLATALALHWWVRSRAAKQSTMRRILADQASGETRMRVGHATRLVRGLRPAGLARRLVRTAVAEGYAGTTIRYVAPRLMTPIVPITVPFEPRPLWDVDDLPGGAEQDTRARQRAPRNWFHERAVMMGGWPVFVAWVVVIVGLTTSMAVTQRFNGLPVLLALVVVGPLCLALLRPVEWLAVPGGLVVRKTVWSRRSWRVRLFDRRRAVLFIAQQYQGRWLLVVGDADGCETGVMTRPAMEAALRAWLSPLSPPSPECLTDAAGAA